MSPALQVRGGVGAPRILGLPSSHKNLGQRSGPGVEGMHVPRCTCLCSQRKLKSYCLISWGELVPSFLKLSLQQTAYQPGLSVLHEHPLSE